MAPSRVTGSVAGGEKIDRNRSAAKRIVAGDFQHDVLDAWIVLSGSRKLLEWFVEHDVPVFALFGRRRGLPVAGVGPDKPPVIAHIRWDDRPATRRALRWADHLARGQRDIRQTLTKAEVVEGGTTRPAP